MKIKITLNGEVLSHTFEDAEASCVLAGLRKEQKTKLEHIPDEKGVLLYVDDKGKITSEVTKKPLMNHVGQFNADGTPIMFDAETFPEWVINAAKGKVNACAKRAHMASFVTP